MTGPADGVPGPADVVSGPPLVAGDEVGAGERPDVVYAAAAILFAARHQLPPDLLRTLADVWTCGCAARYGAPAERFWEPCAVTGDPFAGHDTAACEAEADGGQW